MNSSFSHAPGSAISLNNPGVIFGVQYLRAFAAMTVVWVHAIGETPWGNANSYFGTSGVDLFFVISGFIMIATTSRKPLSPGKFFELRIIRIAPLYWFCTLVIIASALSGKSHHHLNLAPSAIAKSVFFFPYWSLDHPGRIWPMLIQGWTLNYEMFFYVLFALSLFFGRRRLELLTTTLVSLAAIGFLAGPFANAPAQVYTSPMMLEFVAGMWIGRIWATGGLRISLWSAAISIALGTACLGIADYRFAIMTGAAMMLVGTLHPRIASLRFSIFLAVGDASYSIYLTHTFVISALMLIWPRIFPSASTASWVLYMAVVCVLTMLGGWICHRCVERPVTSALRQITQDRARAVAPATS